MSAHNGNGNGRADYERADTPPSGSDFGDLLKLARSVKDTEIALGIVADDVSMLKSGVHRVHVAVQAMRAENESHNLANERRFDDVTAAVLALTASVNDALELGRRAVMKAESAERVSITNEASMDFAKSAAAGLSKAVDVLADKRSDSIRAKAEWRGVWIEYAKKSIPYVLAAAGLIYGVAVKACNQ